MSADNVEIVRRIYEAVARRDAAAVLDLYDPEVEIDLSRLPESGLGGEAYLRGHEGLRHSFRSWSEAWERFEDHCDHPLEAGDQVISIVSRRGRGRASGAEASTQRAGVWTIRDRKVVQVVWFPSVDEALLAAGQGRG
jgi:ketosteroid isomerase-like protein